MVRKLTAAENNNIAGTLLDAMLDIESKGSSPEAQEERSRETIERNYQSTSDGADAGSETTATDDEELRNIIEMAKSVEKPEDYAAVAEMLNEHFKNEARKQLTPSERAPATPQTVKEKIVSQPVGDKFMARWIQSFMQGKAPETEEVKKAKRAHAQSEKTDVKPKDERIRYSKDTCMSQGEEIKYSAIIKGVDWGKAIKENSSSVAESVEHLISFLTNAIGDAYGGWGRITEIIVRDQRLIINRSCFMPALGEKNINSALFPIDTLEYLRAGAVAGFFDWGMLRYMRNLVVLDIDDIGFYETQIGSRLKCGRRIGVSTLFNLCKSLEVLVLGNETATRETLNTEATTPMKKKLAAHKRFHLFADGYKIDVLKGTNSFASWTFGNMTSYACNRGNKNVFLYCGGVLARLGMTGFAGALNLGAHLVGGIVQTIKEATTPVEPEDVGLK